MTEDPIDWQAHRAEAHHLGRLQEFLKQIVYGGNDGIVTTFAIVAGFAGASAEGAEQVGALAVLVFGLANLFADATSMGLGEFLSTRSQRDLYLSQRAAELRELRESPSQERAEVIQMLEERGLSPGDAAAAADRLMKSPELVVDMMMNYELQMPDMRTATPAADGLFTFGAFVVFGAVPLVPYFARPATDPGTFWLSVAATFVALAALGLLRWRATEEGLVRCLAETIAVGSTCAAVAFAVGALVGGLGG
jgi:VIT1/CCC1 family predicted Fe2+/Mn2+ transporter